MDEIEVLRRYAAQSGAAAALRVDVSDRVLETIRRDREERDWLAGGLRPMMMAAAASLLVAISLGFFAQQAVAEMQDPLSSLFTPFVVTLQ
ncbi:MAG: hypothetical protein WD971_06020 [Pirellulales bacterium]